MEPDVKVASLFSADDLFLDSRKEKCNSTFEKKDSSWIGYF